MVDDSCVAAALKASMLATQAPSPFPTLSRVMAGLVGGGGYARTGTLAGSLAGGRRASLQHDARLSWALAGFSNKRNATCTRQKGLTRRHEQD